jgi:hypothetical protein
MFAFRSTIAFPASRADRRAEVALGGRVKPSISQIQFAKAKRGTCAGDG